MNKWVATHLVLKPAYFCLGEPVRTFIPQFEETQWLSQKELHDYQLARLRGILRYVYNHIPYYRKIILDKEINVEEISGLNYLQAFPILTKEVIRKHHQELRSDIHWRRSFRKTSGSTGEPLMIEKDRVTTGVMNAIMWRNYRWFGIEMGSRQARVWAGPVTPGQKWIINITDCLQNRIRLSSFSMNQQTYKDFLKRILRFKPEYFYGYSQFLYQFATYVLKSKDLIMNLNLKAIITTAEMLFDNQKALIEEAFQTKVVNEYGCTETGIIAMKCPKGKMHIMADNLLVEVVKDGRPALDGEEGELLITELYGLLAPLIRYRVGDRGVISRTPCSCGRGLPVLERLTGRVTDVILCQNGAIIDPYIIESLLKARPQFYKIVKQWKIHQLSQSKILITLCTPEARPHSEIESYLQKEVSNLSHKQLDLEFWYEVSLRPEPSGKTKMFSVDH